MSSEHSARTPADHSAHANLPNNKPVAPSTRSVADVDTLLARAVVIIPALNEEQGLRLVLTNLPKVARVYVVDNGSTDGTRSVAAELGADVVAEPRRGYGSALFSRDSSGDGRSAGSPVHVKSARRSLIVAFIDADFSDDPTELANLLAPIQLAHADLVIGSRTLGRAERGALPVQSRFGNWLACTLMWLFFGYRYTDLGPFRAITWRALKQLEMADPAFGWTIEMQLKASARKLRVMEVPVSYRRRKGKSKITERCSAAFVPEQPSSPKSSRISLHAGRDLGQTIPVSHRLNELIGQNCLAQSRQGVPYAFCQHQANRTFHSICLISSHSGTQSIRFVVASSTASTNPSADQSPVGKHSWRSSLINDASTLALENSELATCCQTDR